MQPRKTWWSWAWSVPACGMARQHSTRGGSYRKSVKGQDLTTPLMGEQSAQRHFWNCLGKCLWLMIIIIIRIMIEIVIILIMTGTERNNCRLLPCTYCCLNWFQLIHTHTHARAHKHIHSQKLWNALSLVHELRVKHTLSLNCTVWRYGREFYFTAVQIDSFIQLCWLHLLTETRNFTVIDDQDLHLIRHLELLCLVRGKQSMPIYPDLTLLLQWKFFVGFWPVVLVLPWSLKSLSLSLTASDCFNF